MPKSTHSKTVQAARRNPVADREAFLRALQSGDDAKIESAWPGATVTKKMLADKVIRHHGDGEYSITDLGLSELDPQTAHRNEVLDERYLAEQADLARDERSREYEYAKVDDAAEQQAIDAVMGDRDGLLLRAEIGTTCACGCQAGVTPKRIFRQGHDQKLIGILANAAATGQEVGHVSGGMLVTGSAQTYGARVLKDGGAAKLDDAIRRAVAQAAKPKRVSRVLSTEARSETDTPATDSGEMAGPRSRKDMVQTGDEVKVRIGRHTYFARVRGMNQAGKVTAVAYRTRARNKPNPEIVTEKFTILDD